MINICFPMMFNNCGSVVLIIFPFCIFCAIHIPSFRFRFLILVLAFASAFALIVRLRGISCLPLGRDDVLEG